MIPIRCGQTLTLTALPGLPVVEPGGDLAGLVEAGLLEAGISLQPGDVLVVTSKVVSRAEGRLVELGGVRPTPRALELAERVGRDPRMVELVLAESTAVSRAVPGVLVVRHRLGVVSANAGIDASNVRQARPGEAWVLLWPLDPDASAKRLLEDLRRRTGIAGFAVVISDSLGRAFRVGTVGAALGVAGMPALFDQRGRRDLFGRTLEATVTALADQVAAAADLVAGQAAEGRAVVHLRGLSFPEVEGTARDLQRPPEEDLYA